MSIFLSNGERTCEVIDCDPSRDQISVLCWENEDYGVLYQTRISELNAQGYKPAGA
jgi:hypothetical protein